MDLLVVEGVVLGGVGVPAGIEEVVAGDFLVDFFALGGVYHLDEFGWDASPEFVGTNFCAGEDHGAG